MCTIKCKTQATTTPNHKNFPKSLVKATIQNKMQTINSSKTARANSSVQKSSHSPKKTWIFFYKCAFVFSKPYRKPDNFFHIVKNKNNRKQPNKFFHFKKSLSFHIFKIKFILPLSFFEPSC